MTQRRQQNKRKHAFGGQFHGVSLAVHVSAVEPLAALCGVLSVVSTDISVGVISQHGDDRFFGVRRCTRQSCRDGGTARGQHVVPGPLRPVMRAAPERPSHWPRPRLLHAGTYIPRSPDWGAPLCRKLCEADHLHDSSPGVRGPGARPRSSPPVKECGLLPAPVLETFDRRPRSVDDRS